MVPINSFITHLFYLICWTIAIILTVTQVQKYLKNEDFVDIRYKSFYSKPAKSNYPEFSICLHTNPDNEFDESKLPKNVSSKDVAQFLNGNKPDGGDNSQTIVVLKESLKEFSLSPEMPYDELLKNEVTHVFSGYIMGSDVPNDKKQNSTLGYTLKTFYSLSMTNFTKQFESVNVDTDHFRCWSRHVEFIPGQIIKSEAIAFAKGALISPYLKKDLINAYVSLHHENQLIRSINSMINVAELVNLVVQDSNKLPVLKITVTQMKIIIRRHDANWKCDPGSVNDDEMFLKTVAEMLGCIPIFWKDQSKNWLKSSNLTYCTNPEDYKRYWSHYNSRQGNAAYGKYQSPCRKISLSYDLSSKEDFTELRIMGIIGDLVVMVNYNTEEYEEIISLRKFDGESLFSQIGGLIGIMLGVSFVNIPDMLEKVASKVKEEYRKANEKNR